MNGSKMKVKCSPSQIHHLSRIIIIQLELSRQTGLHYCVWETNSCSCKGMITWYTDYNGKNVHAPLNLVQNVLDILSPV